MNQRRVLIADDDPDVVEILTIALEGVGAQVTGVGTGEAALQCLEQSSYDFVLLDVRMPGRGGLAVARELAETHPGLRVVLMTGFAPEVNPEILATGCPVMRKPFDMRGLLALLG